MSGGIDQLFASPFSAYATVVAIVLFNGGAWLVLKRLRLFMGDRAQGEVTGYVTRMRTDRGSRTLYMPRVRYGSLEHGQHEFVSRMSGDPKRWPIGTRLPVAYSRSDPKIAEIATPARLWLAPIVFWLFAGSMILAALEA